MTTDTPDLVEAYRVTMDQLVENRQLSAKIHRAVLKHMEAHPIHVHRPGTGRTWVWSDLHLNHGNIIKYCNRPFGDKAEMNAVLLGAWRRDIDPGDTVLNGGDTALAGSLKGPCRDEVRTAPGRKVLVAGNHDFHKKTGRLDPGHHEPAVALVIIETEPPLVLTHFPLAEVPPGWVNLHGHVHNNEPLRQSPHVNVCVEHTGYRPVELGRLIALAKHILARGQPEGATTAERLARATP